MPDTDETPQLIYRAESEPDSADGFYDPITGKQLHGPPPNDEPEESDGRKIAAKIPRPDDPFPRDRGLPPRSII